MMAAWQDRLTWREKNLRSIEQMTPDARPTCPRCCDLLDPGSLYCAECGCAVTIRPKPSVHRSVDTVDRP